MTVVLLKGLSWILNRFSPRFILRLGDVLGWFLFACLRFRRQIVVDNLKLAFGDELSDPEIEKLALKNYQHYGRTLFEIIQSVLWTTEDYKTRVIVEGLEHPRGVLTDKQGAFFLTLHLGNWEFAICTAAAHGIPVDVVVKKARTESGEEFLSWYRKKTGAGIFHETGTAKDILRSLSTGRMVGFILDQFMGPPIGLPVKFFGRQAGTAVAVALITEKRDVPIVPAYSYRDEEGRVHVCFDPPVQMPPLSDDKNERLFQKTQAYNDVLEKLIRRHPDQWLWLHRRWKAYRGEPRWMPKVATVTASWLLCALTYGASETGIALPPDPKIDVPKVVTTFSKMPEPNAMKAIPADRIPWSIGERMEISLTWTAIPAGTGIMEVREGTPVNGRPTYLLWGNATSSRLVDAFYHIDNTVESLVDKQAVVPYKFLVHMAESFQKKETRVAFDHTKNRAFYWAKRISEKWGNQDIDRADEIQPRAMDMFSAIYFARTLEFELKKKQSYSVYENGQNFTVELTPVANEFLRTKAGVFQCWKLQAQIAVNNILKPTGETYLWLSDDSKKYVVKFESKLKYGSLTGTLTNIQEKK